MRILFIIFVSLLSAHASAVLMNMQEFKQLSTTQKVMVLKAYKQFVASQNTIALDPKFTSLDWSLIEKAFAASEFNCFYAGWPSVKKTSHGKTVCSSPMKANPSYKSLAKSCKGSEMLCNPSLFGDGLCVSVATSSLRNSAFAQCENKFASSGKDLKSVVDEISNGSSAAETDEMFQLVNEVCSNGFQASTGMCRNLENKVASIKKLKPDTEVAQSIEEQAKAALPEVEQPVAEVKIDTSPIVRTQEAVVVSDTSNALTPDFGQPLLHMPTEQQALLTAVSQAEQIPQVVSDAGTVMCIPEKLIEKEKPVITPDPKVPHIVCRPDLKAKPDPVDAAYVESLIKKLNISFYPSKDQVVKSNDFRLFLNELRKFPQGLLEEMASSGARIRLIIGNSVTDDPDWAKECNARVNATLRYQGQVAAQQMANNCQQTFDGRSWNANAIEGSGGNFSVPMFNAPTRIVLNRFYGHTEVQNGKEIRYNSGTANLFLHEHGHALDDFYGEHTISESPQWMSVMNDPNVQQYLPKILSHYENDGGPYHDKEQFAELFAYYHGCEAAKKQMEEQAPALAQFLANLHSIKSFQRSRVPATKR
jgi:hypothetical protein